MNYCENGIGPAIILVLFILLILIVLIIFVCVVCVVTLYVLTKKLAKKKEIKGYTKMKKDELIDALKQGE